MAYALRAALAAALLCVAVSREALRVRHRNEQEDQSQTFFNKARIGSPFLLGCTKTEEFVDFAGFTSDGKYLVTLGVPQLDGGRSTRRAQVWQVNSRPPALVQDFTVTEWWDALRPFGGASVVKPVQCRSYAQQLDARQLTCGGLAPDGQLIVVQDHFSESKPKVTLTDGTSGWVPLQTYGQVRWASFSPHGKKVVTLSQTHPQAFEKQAFVKVWNPWTGELLGSRFYELGSPMLTALSTPRVAICPDGSCVLTLEPLDRSPYAQAVIWDAVTGNPRIAFGIPWSESVTDVAFSPGGDRVIIAFRSYVEIYDVRPGHGPVYRYGNLLTTVNLQGRTVQSIDVMGRGGDLKLVTAGGKEVCFWKL